MDKTKGKPAVNVLLALVTGAYALVFLVEAGGLLGIIALLLQVDVTKFRTEVVKLSWHLPADAA